MGVDGIIALIILLYLPIIIAALYVNYIVAKHFEKVASEKGYGLGAHVFRMCFWLGIVGYIYTASLPNLNDVRVLKAIDEKLANLSENKE